MPGNRKVNSPPIPGTTGMQKGSRSDILQLEAGGSKLEAAGGGKLRKCRRCRNRGRDLIWESWAGDRQALGFPECDVNC
eukprot:1395006-Alexandrium_andersonii.AAC.1